ncbi:imidazolonepropionase, partial [Candidatus Bipolaricaulota bacterium]|nr:imidazolonepropionase [Candidatus Bipolaricaulota bacterium]
MDKKLVTNIGQLVTPKGDGFLAGEDMNSLEVSEGKEILISEGIIQEVGDRGDFSELRLDDTEVLNAGGKPVLPGFIDPHTHFVFSGYRAGDFQSRLQGKSYEEIAKEGGGILSSVSSTRSVSFPELKEESKKRLGSMARFGVTTVEGKTGYGLDQETELKQLRAMKELDKETP